MPYIDQAARSYIGMAGLPRNPGELNYVVTTMTQRVPEGLTGTLVCAVAEEVEGYLAAKPHIGYAEFNEVLGVLDAAAREYRRRKPPEWPRSVLILARVADKLYEDRVGPYEDTKIKENGDVYS
jgi:hypothetical protein